ncbi:MAG: hypothetical protein DHS20C14_13800 [Phycisphaeraceae bacterium]|nr:MAG: hypothetical protein DHS20C14_13800 [Phycisphaeraceae bacterium]
MGVTDKLHRVFEVDRQMRGLQSRLRAAERFLAEQERQIGELETSLASLKSQLRQLTASSSNSEGEVTRLDAHIEELRERMNNATNNKEYKALLTEVNTFKEQKTAAEGEAVGQLETVDRLKEQVASHEESLAERTKVRKVAKSDRDQRADEIKDKLAELQGQREALVADVPAHVMSVYVELIEVREDEAMAPIEIADRKRHEYHCGSCMMSLPVETMSALLSHGELTRCVSCGCILYLEESTREAMAAKR